jgi:hypothetical protein
VLGSNHIISLLLLLCSADAAISTERFPFAYHNRDNEIQASNFKTVTFIFVLFQANKKTMEIAVVSYYEAAGRHLDNCSAIVEAQRVNTK